MRLRFPGSLFLLLLLVPALQAVYYYPRLPQTVASHFGSGGRPDSWTDKGEFVVVSLAISELLILFMMSLSFFWRLVAAKSENAAQPASVIEAYRERVGSFISWFGLATSGLVLTILQMAYMANVRTPTGRVSVWVPLVIYAIVLVTLLKGVFRAESELNSLCRRGELPPDIWFPAKRFGWGWGLPCRWQGWVFMAAWLSALIGGILLLGLYAKESFFAFYFPFLLIMVVLLLAVCWIKGERPRRRWA